ncbi:MAG: trehalose-phosphatase [Rhodospirillales bacterium]|nr:trehalose-phosphatase [Rhodospirillales bacterium]
MPDLPPLPDFGARLWALFLDVDGTLLELAEHPDKVVVPKGLIPLLQRLRKSFGGACALITGRSLAALEALLGHTGLDAAGCHGAELRMAGAVKVLATADASLPRIAERLARLVDAIAPAMVEVKSHSLALHYRLPALDARRARRIAARALGGDKGRFRLIDGKNVVEILPSDAGKGAVIAWFLNRPPYAGRIPIFVGDDVTDEEGFREVNRRGGISVRVGADGKSAARHRVADIVEAATWLERLAGAATRRGRRGKMK